MAFRDDILALNPSYYLPLDGDASVNVGAGFSPFESGNGLVNGADFSGLPICLDSSSCLISGQGLLSLGRSPEISSTAGFLRSYTVACWVEVSDLRFPSCVYKQGGGSNNMALLSGFGLSAGTTCNNQASSPSFYITTYANREIEAGRPYFLAFTYEDSSSTGGNGAKARLYINGVFQSELEDPSGAIFPVHNGLFTLGNSDAGLIFYGGTLPVNASQYLVNKRLAHWSCFANNVLSVSVLKALFEVSTLAEYTITSQAELDAIPKGTIQRTNLAIRVVSQVDLTLTMDGLRFNNNDIDIQYTGTGTLTLKTAEAGLIFSTPNGGTIIVEAPINQIEISGIPDVPGAILAVVDLSSQAITYPPLTGGAATVPVDAATSYRLAADAPGYLMQSVDLLGNVPSFSFNLPDYRALYESGVSRTAEIAFNYSTYEVLIRDDIAVYSFADIFRTIEDYLATEQGVLFPYPPFPVVVDLGGGAGRNYLFFPYDSDQGQPNPVRIKPDPTNTSDPTLADFVIVLEQAGAPLFDIFDFSSAGGRTIRFQTEAVAASGGGGQAAIDPAIVQQIKDLWQFSGLDPAHELVSGRAGNYIVQNVDEITVTEAPNPTGTIVVTTRT